MFLLCEKPFIFFDLKIHAALFRIVSVLLFFLVNFYRGITKLQSLMNPRHNIHMSDNIEALWLRLYRNWKIVWCGKRYISIYSKAISLVFVEWQFDHGLELASLFAHTHRPNTNRSTTMAFHVLLLLFISVYSHFIRYARCRNVHLRLLSFLNISSV